MNRILHVRTVGLFVLGAMLLIISACNDTPNSVGSDYLNQNVFFKSYKLAPNELQFTSDVAATSNASSGGATAVLVGKTNDATAHAMLGLASINSLVSGSNSKTISSVKLRLRTYGFRYGDTNSRHASFDVVVLDQSFTTQTQWSDTLVAKLMAAPTVGTYNGTYPDTSIIEVDLNASSMAAFFKDYYRFDTTITTVNGQPDKVIKTTILKTLALRARTDGSMVGSFLGSTIVSVTDSLRPSLRVTFTDTTAVADLHIDFSSWIGNSSVSRGKDLVTLCGGIPVRTLVTLSLDSIPTTAVIHEAVFSLHLDTNSSRFSTSGIPKIIIAYIAADSSLQKGSSFLVSPLGYFIGYRVAKDSTSFTDEYRFSSIAPALTTWFRNARTGGSILNNGMILAINRNTALAQDHETSTLNNLIFYGTSAVDTTKRPSLTVLYSLQKDK